MITLNNKKFARNKKELTGSLFRNGSICVGYYTPYKRKINLYNLDKALIGVITEKRVLCKTVRYDNKWWYSYAPINEIGEYLKLEDKHNDILRALVYCKIKAVY